MAEVLLDTNIILDYLNPERPEHMAANMLMEGLFEAEDYKPVMSVSTIKDVYYVLCRKYKPEAMVRQRLQILAESIEPKPFGLDILEAAFASNEPDFEDAIIRVTAEKHNVKAIITRDKAAYKNSHIPSMDARAFSYELD